MAVTTNFTNQSSQEKNMTDKEPTDPWIGKYVIVRCRDAGVHAGILKSRSDRECELTDARRLWYWKAANNGAFLSGVAENGLHENSKIGAPVDTILTENCEIIAVSDDARASIEGMKTYAPN